MEYSNEVIKQYNLLIDTLIRLSIDVEVSTEIIDEYLEELEGDYYTFLHESNLEIFRNVNVLNENQIKNIVELRNEIMIIPTDIWSELAFIRDDRWRKVALKAGQILDSLGVSKRTIDDALIKPGV